MSKALVFMASVASRFDCPASVQSNLLTSKYDPLTTAFGFESAVKDTVQCVQEMSDFEVRAFVSCVQCVSWCLLPHPAEFHGAHGCGPSAFALRNLAPVSRYHACSRVRIVFARCDCVAAWSFCSPTSLRKL
jgi:hypothetical protein